MTISFNYTYSFPFRKTVVVILLFPILLTSCSDEGKDVSADAPAQANEKTNDLSEEKNLDTFDNTMASTVVAQVEQNTTSKASSIAPTLVPVLSKEEADALVERMNQDIANAEKGTITFYREDFFLERRRMLMMSHTISNRTATNAPMAMPAYHGALSSKSLKIGEIYSLINGATRRRCSLSGSLTSLMVSPSTIVARWLGS